jgi:hypothetical protein
LQNGRSSVAGPELRDRHGHARFHAGGMLDELMYSAAPEKRPLQSTAMRWAIINS